MKHRVLIADGHWLIRRGLRATLHHVGDHEVIGEAINGDEAAASTLALAPDLVLIDVGLPEAGGIEAMRRIRQRRPGQKVLLLSAVGNGDDVREALRSGCNGYLCTGAADADLLAAIDAVRGGETYLDAGTTRQMVLDEHRRETQDSAGPLLRLSARELAVFRLVGAGLTNREAAAKLQLGEKSVEKYRAALMHKLGLRDAVALRLLAHETGVTVRPAARRAATGAAEATA